MRPTPLHVMKLSQFHKIDFDDETAWVIIGFIGSSDGSSKL